MDSSDDQNTEIEELKKKLTQSEQRAQRLERYNEELRAELRLMTEKFLLSKQIDEQQQQQIHETTNHQSDKHQTNSIIDPKELNEMKALSAEFSDYHYDSNSKTYFNRSIGWYYYPQNNTFYNTNDKRYYKYNESNREYTFICNLDGSTTIENEDHVKSQPKSTFLSEDDNVDDDEEIEDGEINDDDECIEISSDSDKGDDQRKSAKVDTQSKIGQKRNYNGLSSMRNLNQIPPCRLIVKKSDSLECDSILIISCMGGKIGQHSNCTATIPDKTISQIHAEINYDLSRRIYMIQDLLSKNGTFINGKRLSQLERTPLNHGDEIVLADCCQLIVHIHSNRDDDCRECDGSSIHLKQDTTGGIYSNYQTKSTRSAMKSLKRKYGLETYSMVADNETNENNQRSYRDRAAERQKTVGSDCPYEKTAAGSAIDLPLNDGNKGYRMLERMGWKSGQSLGKSANQNLTKKLLEPIEIIDDHHTNDRRGLGYGS